MYLLRHLKDFLITYKRQYLLGVSALIIVDLLQLIPPKIIGSITDSIKSGTIDASGITLYGFIIIGIACLVAIFRYFLRMNIIGSARKLECWLWWLPGGSLPNRQLRNLPPGCISTSQRSLPNRQLRNDRNLARESRKSSLPNRQLRNWAMDGFHNPLCSLPNRQLRKNLQNRL